MPKDNMYPLHGFSGDESIFIQDLTQILGQVTSFEKSSLL